MEYTITDFTKDFPDDDACLERMFLERYGELKFCPKCAAETTFHKITDRKCYSCKFCGYHIYPLAGSIFHKSPTPLKLWFFAIFLFSTSRNGVSAKELQRQLGVTYKTAWRMANQIRKLMEQDNNRLDGDVEVDETYAPSRRHTRIEGRGKKQIIFGAVERGGRANVKHVKSSGARVLLTEIEKRVEVGAFIHSDEWQAYKTLEQRGYSHTTVNHSKLEYVRGTAHTNTIEGFWSQLKRSVDGTYHAISPKYLQSYIDEFVFRYNRRNNNEPTFQALLRLV